MPRIEQGVSMSGRCAPNSHTLIGVYDDRLRAAAQRVLDGDGSGNAVRDLEGVLLDDYPGDERFDDLLEACALYAAGMESPYVGRAGIRDAILHALSAINADK